MTPKKRLKLPKAVEKRIYQEAGSRCPFCAESEVTALEVHHVDENPSNNAAGNLLLVCSSCHSKITGGAISEADVRTKKRELEWSLRPSGPMQAGVNVSINSSEFHGDIAHNITKIVTPRPPRVKHPEGSLGADLQKKGYVDYLIERYFEFRKADPSFGRRRPFSYAEIHKTIQKEFGHKTFFMPVQLFDRLVEFLQFRIDRTILGKRNGANGVASYHSFQEHLQRHGS